MNNKTELELRMLAELFGDADPAALRFIGHQVSTVDAMGHQLMTLAGVLLAITVSILPSLPSLGFFPRNVLIAGNVFVLMSALANGIFVFRLKWVTSITHPVERNTLSSLCASAIAVRDNKVKAYHASLALILLGLLCYLITILSALI